VHKERPVPQNPAPQNPAPQNPASQNIVVTGGSSGVGLAAARQFAALGHHVVVVGRNPQRLADAVALVRAAGDGREPDQFRADFESFDDVRALAGHLLDTYEKIDVLASNAGGMVGGYRTTRDGFEATLQSNHLGPFLLADLLRERLSGGRIVATASDAHRRAGDPADFVSSPAGFSPFRTYGAAKVANILFAAEAARRWPDIFSVSFHPGVVATNFGAGRIVRLFYRMGTPFLVSPEKAGALLVWLATTPEPELVDGGYYVGHRAQRPAPAAADPARAAALWEASLKAVGDR
jgi:NAD(P)-dependent dehydrogenase (short-subunit alcohol dehydrogenase family)